MLRATLRQARKHFRNHQTPGNPAPVAAGVSHEEFLAIQSQVADLDVMVRQLMSILEQENDIPAPPPKHLQVRVVGGYVPDFLVSGLRIFEDLTGALKPSGKTLADFPAILDYGCGCGRAVRVLKKFLPSCRLSGIDIDGEAIEWLNRHYAKFGQFVVAPHLPPTPFSDHAFDFVFGLSVFTHLPEDMQFLWLEELRRITRPGGYLVLSTHGEKHYRQKAIDPKVLEIMETKGFFYSDFGFNYGKSISLPDFYQTAFHSHDYIRREWARYFEVIDIQALRLDNNQDTVLLRNRG